MACGKGLGATTKSMLNITREEERWTRVFNGKDAVLGEIPWQAGLTDDPNAADIVITCGGTLINANWVISAMHCFDPRSGGWR